MMLKNLLVFTHLIAMAVAVGKILECDLRLLLRSGEPLGAQDLQALAQTERQVGLALVLLWLSGLTLVGLGQLQSASYLENQKLWAKALIVLALTFNGLALHRWAFPAMRRGQALLALPSRQLAGLSLMASTSTVSWLYACFLGIARNWNHQASLSFALTVYALLLLAAWCGSALLLGLMAAARRQPPTLRSPCLQRRG